MPAGCVVAEALRQLMHNLVTQGWCCRRLRYGHPGVQPDVDADDNELSGEHGASATPSHFAFALPYSPVREQGFSGHVVRG